MTRLMILCAALAAVGAGCGGRSEAPLVSAAGCGSRSSSSELRVRELRVAGAPVPIEGEISYLSVRRVGGAAIANTVLSYGGRAFRCHVSSGRYAVAVWHRFCDANCGNLDPISDRCRSVVRVRANAKVRVTIWNSPGSPCRIVVTRSIGAA